MAENTSVIPFDTSTIPLDAPASHMPQPGDMSNYLTQLLPAIPRAATQFVPGLVSSVLSSPDAKGIETAIPSAASNLYRFLDSAQSVIGHAIGTPEFHLPGAQRASELADSALKPGSIASMIPAAPAQNQTEAVLGDMARSAGQMGLPASAAMTGLPAAVKTAASFAMPGLESASALPIAAGITGVVDTATGTTQAQAAQPQSSVIPLDATQTTQTEHDPVTGFPVPPIPPAVIPLPVPPEQQTNVPVVQPFDDMLYPQMGSTWTERALWGAGALVALAAGPKAFKFLGELTGNTREIRYGEASLPYNMQQADYAAGRIPRTDAPVPAPLPGKAGDASTTAAEAVMDRSARIHAYNDATAASPTDAAEMRAQTGNINNDMAFRDRFTWIANTGEDPVSGIKMPSLTDHYVKIGNGTPEQRMLYDRGRSAADELDNRVTNWRNAQPQTSVKYQGYTDQQLRDDVTAAKTDPQVASWIAERQQINNTKIDILQARQMLTSGEAARLKAAHPDYMPSADVSGIIENPLVARDITPGSGADKHTTPVWELDKQHDEAIFKAIEQNDIRRNFITNTYDYYNRTPAAAKIVRPSKDAQGKWIEAQDGTSLPVRINGQLQYHIVDSPAMRTMLEQSPHATGSIIAWGNAARNTSQSFITGTGSAIAGHWYAPKGAVRYALEGSIIRPAGTAGSYPDKAMQMATGGRLSLRGDPSAVATMPYEIAAGVGARGAEALASALDPAATNFANVKLRSVFGNNVVDALHTRLQATWYNSIRAQMQRGGASNSAGFSSVPIPNAQVGAYKNTTSVLNNLAPNLFRVNGPMGGATPYVVKLNALFNEIKEIVGGAAHAQYFRLNAQLSPAQRVYATRNLVGDPGTHGMASAVQNWGALTDYGNIALQEGGAVGRSWRDNPVTFTTAMMTGLGIPALASIYSAMLHGPDAIKHMTEEISNQDAAGNVTLYIPGMPVESAMKIPIGINLHMFYPTVKRILMDVLGLQAHEGNPGLAQWAMDGMHDFFSKHGSTSMIDQTVAGMSAATPPILPTAVAGLTEAITGKTPSLTPDTAYQMANKFPNTGAMFSHNVAGDSRAPGRIVGGDTLTGSTGGNLWKHIITSAMGVVGSAINSATQTYSATSKATGDADKAMGNVLKDYTGRLQESLPFLNGVIWNHDDRLATQTPLVQRVEDARDAMRTFTSWKADIVGEGLTRSKGIPLPMAPEQKKYSSDPVIQQMAATVGTYAGIIETKLMPPIQDLQKQRDVLKESALSPEAQRKLYNVYTRDMQKKYEEVADTINDANYAISQLAGKHVTVTKGVDWQRDSSQFK